MHLHFLQRSLLLRSIQMLPRKTLDALSAQRSNYTTLITHWTHLETLSPSCTYTYMYFQSLVTQSQAHIARTFLF